MVRGSAANLATLSNQLYLSLHRRSFWGIPYRLCGSDMRLVGRRRGLGSSFVDCFAACPGARCDRPAAVTRLQVSVTKGPSNSIVFTFGGPNTY